MSSKTSNKDIIPECPKLIKIHKKQISRKPSFINLIEVDDDSEDSDSNHQDIFSYTEEQNKMEDELNISDDRYEDSFDEDFYEKFETNPTSSDLKGNNKSGKMDLLKKQNY